MKPDLTTITVVAAIALFVGFWLGFAVRAAISRRRRRQAMTGWR